MFWRRPWPGQDGIKTNIRSLVLERHRLKTLASAIGPGKFGQVHHLDFFLPAVRQVKVRLPRNILRKRLAPRAMKIKRVGKDHTRATQTLWLYDAANLAVGLLAHPAVDPSRRRNRVSQIEDGDLSLVELAALLGEVVRQMFS